MPKNISTLCSLLGYSRQALYQGRRQHQQQAYKEALIIQQVQMIRLTQTNAKHFYKLAANNRRDVLSSSFTWVLTISERMNLAP